MGHLYRVGKVWYLSYLDPSGRRIRRSARTQFKDAARLALHRAELQTASGVTPRPPLPLADFLRSHLEAQAAGLSHEATRRYRQCLSNLLSVGSPMERLMLANVTVGAVSEYVYARLRDGARKGTLDKELGWLKAALAEAARRDLLSWETVARIRDELSRARFPALRDATRQRDRILLPNELRTLLEAAGANGNLRDAITMALWTGLRQRNILELSEAQVDFSCEPAVARFEQADMKGRRSHLVYLPERVKAVLWARWKGIPTRRFFSDFRPAWKRLMKRLRGRVDGLRFHDLRGSYITYRLAAGIDPKTVQAEVGHRDSRMTMDRYARAVRDPGIRAWAMQHFRFGYDAGMTAAQEQRATEGTKRDVTEQSNVR